MSEASPLEPDGKRHIVEVDWNPPVRHLRQFGVAAMVLLPLLGWLFCGRPGPASWATNTTYVVGGLFAAGAALAALSFVFPTAVRPVFVGATIVALPIGLVVGELLLLVVYFLLFAPIAIGFRLAGRDALGLKLDRNAKSYWQPKKKASGPASYFRMS